MKEDDDEVGFDLSAWEAPPPPAGIADAVIARVTAPIAAGAVEAAAPRFSRWWIAGGIAAVAIGAVSIALLSRGTEEVANSSGAVATAKPSHLELGGTAVDLEASTDLWWVRDGKRVVALQPRGKATYAVPPGEELRIDAGATVASVSASGASLRVEVEMNLSDARLIGASAGTAAAIALVTVIVYEGHVKVSGNDKTVEVAAGSTVQIAPNKPPVEPDLVSGREKRLEAKIKLLELENQLLREKAANPVATVDPDEAVKDVDRVLKAAAAQIKNCRNGFTGKAESVIVIDRLAGPRLDFDTDQPPNAVQECLAKLVAGLKFAPTTEGAFDHTWTFNDPVAVTPSPKRDDNTPATPAPTPVDSTPAIDCRDAHAIADAETKGDAAMSNGAYGKSLQFFEKVLKCKPSVAQKTYLAACRARDFPKAKVYFRALGSKDFLAQICLKEGYDPRK